MGKKHQQNFCFNWCLNWRRGWDSNPCDIAVKRFSRPPRYDRFDTSPYEIDLAKLRENCEMGNWTTVARPLKTADYLAKSPIFLRFWEMVEAERRVFQDRLVVTTSICLRIFNCKCFARSQLWSCCFWLAVTGFMRRPLWKRRYTPCILPQTRQCPQYRYGATIRFW